MNEIESKRQFFGASAGTQFLAGLGEVAECRGQNSAGQRV